MAEYNDSPDIGTPGDIWGDFITAMRNIKIAKAQMSEDIRADNPGEWRYVVGMEDKQWKDFPAYETSRYPDNPNLRLPRSIDPRFNKVIEGEADSNGVSKETKQWLRDRTNASKDAFLRQKEIVTLRERNPEAQQMATKIEQLTRDYQQAQANVSKNFNTPGGPNAKEKLYWLSGELEWALSDWNKKLPKWGIGSVAERPKGGYLLESGLGSIPFIGQLGRLAQGGKWGYNSEGEADVITPAEISQQKALFYSQNGYEQPREEAPSLSQGFRWDPWNAPKGPPLGE